MRLHRASSTLSQTRGRKVFPTDHGRSRRLVQPLIQERLNQIPENRRFELRHNTIGKPGTTKTWHTFNHPSLNGINDEQTLKWCNPAWDIQHLGCEETENKKLQDILSETQIVENKFHLVIAQGDPSHTETLSEATERLLIDRPFSASTRTGVEKLGS